MSGVDPKSIVCEFFRHGQCAKGFKCKYSHDLSVERKGEKIDIYSDQRDTDGELNEVGPMCITSCGCFLRFGLVLGISTPVTVKFCRQHGGLGSGNT